MKPLKIVFQDFSFFIIFVDKVLKYNTETRGFYADFPPFLSYYQRSRLTWQRSSKYLKGGKKCIQVCWKVGKVDLQSVPPKKLQGYGVHSPA